MSPSRKDTADQTPGSIDRRGFLTSGAAAAGAAAAISAAPAQAQEVRWDREADVVIIGGGAGGLTSAIAAREKGASVIIVEMNFDIGGRAMMSFGGLYIGGGSWLSEPVCQALEREFGRPAISNQSAMIWDTLTRLRAWQPIPGQGRLLSVA